MGKKYNELGEGGLKHRRGCPSSNSSTKELTFEEKQDNEWASITIKYNEAYDEILGYCRMTDYINHFSQTNYSQNYIHQLMKELKVHTRIRRKKANYKKAKPEQIGKNILARNFIAEYPNQKWCTDITEFKVLGQK